MSDTTKNSTAQDVTSSDTFLQEKPPREFVKILHVALTTAWLQDRRFVRSSIHIAENYAHDIEEKLAQNLWNFCRKSS